MASDRQFCYTLDVLTDGSEHTGCGTLFLSVWKIPLSARPAVATASYSDDSLSESSSSDDDSSSLDSDGENDAPQQTNPPIDKDHHHPEENTSDHYSWLIGNSNSTNNLTAPDISPAERHTPVARYAISGLGDATARLCADQRFKLAPTRACFVPELGTTSTTSDGLSALFLALHGAGAPSLHVVVPSPLRKAGTSASGDGDGFVEELATIILGAHKKLDIRTCEIRGHHGNDEHDSLTWWKVYEDGHLIVHASSSIAHLSSSEGKGLWDHNSEGESSSKSLTFLYSFPTLQARNDNRNLENNPYCTLALFPPQCRNVEDTFRRLLRENLPMIQDDVPMKSIDYVIFLDPNQSFSFASNSEETEDGSCSILMKNSQILTTLPRNYNNLKENELGVSDEGILMRSQQLHRFFHSSMPCAFVEPRSRINSKKLTNSTEEKTRAGYLVLKSGTSIVLEKIKNKRISSQKQLKARIWDRRASIWTKELKDEWTRQTLDSLRSFVIPKIPSSVGVVTQNSTTDENEIDLDDETDTEEQDSKESLPVIIDDENEIDLDLDEENSSGGEDPRIFHPSSSIQEKVPKRSGNEESQRSKTIGRTSDNNPRLLVLGTGSATPSAYRGASGYALIFPSSNDGGELSSMSQPYCYGNARGGVGPTQRNSTLKHHDTKTGGDEIYILDCGEGVSTMLSRNCGHKSDWTRRVRGIWISHAHLDHYGGLPTLLRLLWKERESVRSSIVAATSCTEERFSKRPRRYSNGTVSSFTSSPNRIDDYNTAIPVPWVVAPAKVLRYLDLILNCQHGRSKDGLRICFEPRLHHDRRQPSTGNSFPFSHFENFRVQHNCCPAYGLLIGWKKTSNRPESYNNWSSTRERSKIAPCTHQFLCYSGDTWPSKSLVRVCQRALQQRNSQTYRNGIRIGAFHENNDDLLLIHEATFREAEATMAHKKKHSTIREALMVASDIPCCSRVLLTHFSQRYDNIPSLSSEIASHPSQIHETIHTNQSVNTNCNTFNNSWSTNNNIEKSRNANADSLSIGLAVDGLWINLE